MTLVVKPNDFSKGPPLVWREQQINIKQKTVGKNIIHNSNNKHSNKIIRKRFYNRFYLEAENHYKNCEKNHHTQNKRQQFKNSRKNAMAFAIALPAARLARSRFLCASVYPPLFDSMRTL